MRIALTSFIAACLVATCVAATLKESLTPTQRMAAVGFNTSTLQSLDTLKVSFPLSIGGKVSTNPTEAELKLFYVELLRLSVVTDALHDDPKALATLRSALDLCSACTFVVGKLRSSLMDYGCDFGSGIFGSACASIPFIGPDLIPACVSVLHWACSKLLEYISSGLYSDTQICNLVFDNVCSS
jgi:hypothetical protein